MFQFVLFKYISYDSGIVTSAYICKTFQNFLSVILLGSLMNCHFLIFVLI